MPENKNQHFVPKAHFLPFAHSDGHEVNLVLKKTRAIVGSVPVKSQCSGDYFYGKDLVTDPKHAEGRYASVVSDLVQSSDRAGVDELEYLREFCWLQHHRVPAAISKRRSAFVETRAKVAEQLVRDPGEIDVSHQTLVAQALSFAARARHVIADLRCVLLDAACNVDFITSDNPAVVINKWYAQRLPAHSWGYQQSGLMLFMPLTPRMAFLAYDRQVYDLNVKNGRVRVGRGRDIELLNAILAAYATETCYFSRETPPEVALAALEAISSFPVATEAPLIEVLEPDLLRMRAVRIRPCKWPGFIKTKPKPTFFEARGGRGHVRNPLWMAAAAPRDLWIDA